MGGAIVLRYHRIARLETDPHAIAVTPENFRQQMEMLRRDFHPISLDALVASFSGGRVPRRGVAVTFDDGYEDNLTEARAILEQYEVPATCFVTAGYVGGQREFWWDVLERVLLGPGDLPERVRLPLGESGFEFDLGSSARYGASEAATHRGWNWRAETDPTRRHALFRRLTALLGPLEGPLRQDLVEQLTSWAGLEPMVRPDHRVLTGEQLRALAAGGLVGIGAHSMTHPLLSRLSPDQQWTEIHRSKAVLEAVLDRPVSSFAYPFGVRGRTEDLVRRAGFLSGWGVQPGVVFRGRGRFRLPRLYAGNYGGEELARRIPGLA
jgi:peptidoglycan/xylan/chitin deacetylase (PgdA/CDA1 family)